MARVVVLGGAGDMAAVAVRQLLAARPDVSVVLADRDAEKAERRAATLGAGRASALAVDVLDATALHAAVQGADLAINATGAVEWDDAVDALAGVAERGG